MALAQIIKDRDGVTFIEQKLGADASDVAGATDNENFHAPQNRRAARLINPKCDSMRFWPMPVSHSPASPMIDWNLKPLAWLRTDYFFEATQPSFCPGRVLLVAQALRGFSVRNPIAGRQCRHCALPSASSRACSVCKDRSC